MSRIHHPYPYLYTHTQPYLIPGPYLWVGIDIVSIVKLPGMGMKIETARYGYDHQVWV